MILECDKHGGVVDVEHHDHNLMYSGLEQSDGTGHKWTPVFQNCKDFIPLSLSPERLY